MYSLLANEKLGMAVEKVRLEEIRQEIEARRLAGKVQGRRFGVGTLIHALSTFGAGDKIRFIAKASKQVSIKQELKSQKSFSRGASQ